MKIPHLCLLSLCCLLFLAGHAQDTTWYGAVSDNNPRPRINSITTKTDSGWRKVNYYTSGKVSSTSMFADDSCTIARATACIIRRRGRYPAVFILMKAKPRENWRLR